MAGPSGSSAKGYTAVPQTEQIDDGVENPRTSIDMEDNDDLYTGSAPLLSQRSRGNEPPSSNPVYCWYHKLVQWRPFRRSTSRHYDSWDAPRKPRNWRNIIFWLLFLFFFLAAVGLGTSTGILAVELQHKSSSCRGCTQWRWQQTTRLPFSNAWESSNSRLDFPRVYPYLASTASIACHQAFNQLNHIQCHEKIWNRSWDNGKHALFDPDISMYSQAICTPRCTQDIWRAFDLISSQCTEEDKFDMTFYQGPFSMDPELEEGPLAAVTTIKDRLRHTCRQEPTSNYYWQQAQYCTTVMWEDWHIVDGMNAGNLEGLDIFEKKSNRSYSEYSRYKYRSVADMCDNVQYYNNRRVPQRSYGPGVNETSCGWCTINWFERKLLGWKEEEVRDPKTGDAVGLKDYLRRIKRVGQRCDADAWNRAWARALRKYKDSGDLIGEWDGEGDGKKENGKTGKGDAAEEEFHTLPVALVELN